MTVHRQADPGSIQTKIIGCIHVELSIQESECYRPDAPRFTSKVFQRIWSMYSDLMLFKNKKMKHVKRVSMSVLFKLITEKV